MDTAVKTYDLGSIALCPECYESLYIKVNKDLEDSRICIHKCPKCYREYVEVLLIK